MSINYTHATSFGLPTQIFLNPSALFAFSRGEMTLNDSRNYLLLTYQGC